MLLLNESTGLYATDQQILDIAKNILHQKFIGAKYCVSCPQSGIDFLRHELAEKEHEIFGCIFLDAKNQVIKYEEMFRGTLTQASVYPREVVKSVLHHNAAAVIFAHNHPSGFAEPSSADKSLTQTLKHALELIDVKVLDHIIIAGNNYYSFSGNGDI